MKYFIQDHGETVEDAQEVPNADNLRKVEAFAVKAAEYCHSNRDGWEWNWPTTFVVVADDGRQFSVAVNRETVPEFYADIPVELTANKPNPA